MRKRKLRPPESVHASRPPRLHASTPPRLHASTPPRLHASTAFAAVLLLAVSALTGASCRKQAQSDRDSSNFAALPQGRYERIVSLAPNLTEILFRVGAGDRLAGRTSFCDFPPEAHSAPVVSSGPLPDLERVLEVLPDLVVALVGSVSSLPEADLRAAGIEVYWTRLETASDVSRTIRELGRVTGNDEQGQRIAGKLEDELEQLKTGPGGQSVLMVHGHRPLIAAGKGSWGDELIRWAGYRNVLADSVASYPVLDLEKVAGLRPDYLVDTSFSQTPGELQAFWNSLDLHNDSWQLETVLLSDQSLLRPGPRMAKAVRLLKQRLSRGGE